MPEYKIEISAWKVLQVFIYGGIGAVVSHLSGLPPTQTIVLAIAILTAVRNYLKHR